MYDNIITIQAAGRRYNVINIENGVTIARLFRNRKRVFDKMFVSMKNIKI